MAMMKISHVLPLLLCLISSLFFLPALGIEIKFKNCTTSIPAKLIRVTAVKMSPDTVKRGGNVDLKIFATADSSISEDPPSFLTKVDVAVNSNFGKAFTFCGSTDSCPLEGGPFGFTLTDIFLPGETLRTPTWKNLLITVIDYASEEEFMCIELLIHVSGN